ncbi:transcriptional repressor LexA [Patescibacteria group bacterium]|nr:transcriptional repressor LexA [Patescibacteria group bacterium]
MLENQRIKIADFYQKQRRMPSYREMLKLFGFKSKNAVHKVVKKLVDAELITQDEQGRLLPQTLPRQLYGGTRLLGLIEAGFPSPAEEELLDTISLDDFLIKHKEASYLLKVSGDSMIDAGILPGDLVVAERTSAAGVGDIVIAEIDGEWTIKYLRKQSNRLYLEPANKKYQPIFPKEDLQVAGVVRGVVRKY